VIKCVLCLALQYGWIKKWNSTLPPAAGQRLYQLDGKFIWTHALTEFIGPYGLVWQFIRMQMSSSHHCDWLRTLSLTAHSANFFHAVCPLVISCYTPSLNRSLAHFIESDEILNGLLRTPHLLCHEDTLKCSFCNTRHAYIKGQKVISLPNSLFLLRNYSTSYFDYIWWWLFSVNVSKTNVILYNFHATNLSI